MKKILGALLAVLLVFSSFSAMAETVFSGKTTVKYGVKITDLDGSTFTRDWLIGKLSYKYSESKVYSASFDSGNTITSTKASTYLSGTTIIAKLTVGYICSVPPYGTVQPDRSIWYPPVQTVNATAIVTNRL